MTELEYKITIAIKFIKRYKKNIRFIKQRMAIQKEKGYSPWRRTSSSGHVYHEFHAEIQYFDYDLEEMERKLNIVKLKLENL